MDFALAWPPRADDWCYPDGVQRDASVSACKRWPVRDRCPVVAQISLSMVERSRISVVARFRPEQRLQHKPEFDLLYRDGRRYSDAYFLLLARRNSLPYSRLGLSISAKAVGNAVNRNRVKRVVRESFRVHASRINGLDLVVNARVPARVATNLVLARSLEQLWDKLARNA
jgi:ribonuclease P protein component